MKIEEVNKLLGGVPGSKVRIKLSRSGMQFDTTLVRANIESAAREARREARRAVQAKVQEYHRTKADQKDNLHARFVRNLRDSQTCWALLSVLQRRTIRNEGGGGRTNIRAADDVSNERQVLVATLETLAPLILAKETSARVNEGHSDSTCSDRRETTGIINRNGGLDLRPTEDDAAAQILLEMASMFCYVRRRLLVSPVGSQSSNGSCSNRSAKTPSGMCV